MGLRKSYEELEVTDGPLDLHRNNINNVAQIEPRQIGGNIHVAGEYPGNSATDRLRSALDAASEHDTIFLENERYSEDLTIDGGDGVKLVGEITYRTNGTHIYGADWEFGSRVTLKNVGGDNGATVTVGQYSSLLYCNFGNAGVAGTSVTMDGTRSKVVGCNFINVTLTGNFSNSLFMGNRVGGTLTNNSGGGTLVVNTY